VQIVGILAEVTDNPKIQAKGELAWTTASQNMDLEGGDKVMTGSQSTALIKLSSGSQIDVEENSVVEVVPLDSDSGRDALAPIRIRVRSGTIKSRSKEQDLEVELGQQVVKLKKNSEFTISSKGTVQILSGAAEISTGKELIEIKEGQQAKLEADSEPKISAIDFAVLGAEKKGEQWELVWRGSPPELDPTEPIAIEFSATSKFKEILKSDRIPATSQPRAFTKSLIEHHQISQLGQVFWRARGLRTGHLSEVMNFMVPKDQSAQPLFPRDGAQVQLNTPLTVYWHRLPDVDQYRLSIHREGKLVFTKETSQQNAEWNSGSEVGIFTWAVQYRKKDGEWTSPSEAFKIEVKDATPVVAPPPPPDVSDVHISTRPHSR
jgi:hypothetical protein